MVAIVGNIKIAARTTLNVPKPLMQTPTNNVVKLNTHLQAVRIKDTTGKAAAVHQGVLLLLTIKPELRKNALTAIKKLVPTIKLEAAMGIATMGH